MSGADLANLVNEAALHAVRRGSPAIEMVDFEASRDRVLMGQRRESLVLSDAEKERVAFHEGGHAVLAYVLEDADPVHKVTILPTGMALGVTMQLPMEERHIHPRQHIEDSLCVRMGGRVAELLVYGDLSTGAANDLVGNTELARKMVREWGMSEEIGPMAWGSQGQVFLGEDLMHTRDYSEDTSQVIDDEVESILRAQEQRALEVLTRHRGGLDAVARALLDAGDHRRGEVGRLVDEAYGRPVHEHGAKAVPHFNGNGNGNGHGANGTGVGARGAPTGTGSADADAVPTTGGPGAQPAWAPPAWPGQPQPGGAGRHWPPPQWPPPPNHAAAARGPPPWPAPGQSQTRARPGAAGTTTPSPDQRRPGPQPWGMPGMATTPGMPAGVASDITATGPVAWTSKAAMPAAASAGASITLNAPGAICWGGTEPNRVGPLAPSTETVTVTVVVPVLSRARAKGAAPVTGGWAARAGLGRSHWREATVVASPGTALASPHWGVAPALDEATVRSTTTPGPPTAVTVVAKSWLSGTRSAAVPEAVVDCTQVESAGTSWTKGATGPEGSRTAMVTCSGTWPGLKTENDVRPPVTSTLRGKYERAAGWVEPRRSDSPEIPFAENSWSSWATIRPDVAWTTVDTEDWFWT